MDMQCHEVIQMTAVTTASADRVQLALPGGRTPSGGGNWLVPSPPPLGHDGAREGEDVDVDSDPAQRKLKGVKSAPACLEEPDLACTNPKEWQKLHTEGLDLSLIQRTDLSGTKSPVMPLHSTLQVRSVKCLHVQPFKLCSGPQVHLKPIHFDKSHTPQCPCLILLVVRATVPSGKNRNGRLMQVLT